MAKIARFLTNILEKGLVYSIHVSIILIVFAVIFVDFLWSDDMNKNIGAVWAEDSKIYEMDSKKVSAFLDYVYDLVPPLITGENSQNISFLTEGENFLNKPLLPNTIISSLEREKITTYTVSEGDTIWTIAYRFEITTDTLKWANGNIEDWENLMPGQELVVLPVNGLLYAVEDDDSLSKIATYYGLSTDKIMQQNKLASNDLYTGQELVLPGAKKYRNYVYTPITTIGGKPYTGRILTGTGNFSWPVDSPQKYITQYFGWVTNTYKHTGIDLDRRNSLGIYASDRGTVVAATYGYGGGYGNHVIVDHGNGYQTLYAHLSSINVNVGDDVEQGQTVGIMGTTGYSTGVHLHFEIRQDGTALNPIAYLP